MSALSSGSTITGDVSVNIKESLINENSNSSGAKNKYKSIFNFFREEVDPDKPWIASIRRNDSIENTNGLSNKIVTTKYTLLSWLPHSILLQFRRVANIYFLVISVMMMIGTYFKEFGPSK